MKNEIKTYEDLINVLPEIVNLNLIHSPVYIGALFLLRKHKDNVKLTPILDVLREYAPLHWREDITNLVDEMLLFEDIGQASVAMHLFYVCDSPSVPKNSDLWKVIYECECE